MFSQNKNEEFYRNELLIMWSLPWLPLCCQESDKSDATEEKSDATEEKSEATEDKSDSKDEKSDATSEAEAHTEDKADEGAPEEAQSDQTPPEGQQVIFPFSLWSEGFTCAKHMKHKPTGPPGVPQGDWLQSVFWMYFLWYEDHMKSG